MFRHAHRNKGATTLIREALSIKFKFKIRNLDLKSKIYRFPFPEGTVHAPRVTDLCDNVSVAQRLVHGRGFAWFSWFSQFSPFFSSRFLMENV